MRVFIIGGTRFIGPAVVARLIGMDCQVAVFHRGQTQADLAGAVEHILGDRHTLADYAQDFKRFAPHVVLDMFPLTERDVESVLRTFKGLAGRVVAISSQDVYQAYGKLTATEPGPPDSLPLTEDAPLRSKLYPYRGQKPRQPQDPRRWMDDYDKILVERVIMSDPELPGTVLRLPMVYGPRDTQHRLFEYLKRMDDGRRVILLEEGLANWRWTRGYVENIASAIALAITDQRAAGRVYNVGEINALSTAEWVKAIGQAAGWCGKITVLSGDHAPAFLAPGINTAHHLVTDSSRIRTELGYKEDIDQDTALLRTVAWERAHPPDKVDLDQFDYKAEDALLNSLDSPSR